MARPLRYEMKDFRIVKKTGDKRIPYSFVSRDKKVEANVFWEPRDVNIRAIIIDKRSGKITGSLSAGYPFGGGIGEPPKPEIFLKSLIRQLKWGQYNNII
jgi:hypothetical protein